MTGEQRTIEPRHIDLGGFQIRRSLPTRGLRAVGPWVFFDHFGPHDFAPGTGVDVIPHPHIGLSTVTYLFDGQLQHRDSIGTDQIIRPGAVNLMTARSGIVHSERTPQETRTERHSIHGLQLWHALPEGQEEGSPSFHHYSAKEIPETSVDGATVRVLMGAAFGVSSPVETYAPTLYAEIKLAPGSGLEIPDTVAEVALYGISGSATAGSIPVEQHRFVVLTGEEKFVTSDEGCRIALVGGDPVGKRYIWWNFVSSKIDRIESAMDRWSQNQLGTVPEDDEERAPLPVQDKHSHLK